LANAGQEWNVQRPIGRQPAAATEVLRLEETEELTKPHT
jgi:hypothetical protein